MVAKGAKDWRAVARTGGEVVITGTGGLLYEEVQREHTDVRWLQNIRRTQSIGNISQTEACDSGVAETMGEADGEDLSLITGSLESRSQERLFLYAIFFFFFLPNKTTAVKDQCMNLQTCK